MKKVLFICTHNASRSQMAEGFLRSLRGDRYEAFSAGTEPRGIHPYAVRVMAEAGIDMGGQCSKSVDEFQNSSFDEVITVCDSTREFCPVFFGGGSRRHQSFPDPSLLQGTEEEILAGFRSVRDAIRNWIEAEFSADEA
ncbi:MAG: arsenate reductase ArsC [Syntrophaceae bacterium]|nr:arsenate reductase ArsC [Syntrophaceae bacterium]